MITEIVTPPTGEVVTLSEAKTHMVVEHTADDGYINMLIQAAIAQVETITWRRLLTQTWLLYLVDWPDGDYIELPYGNLQSVTSVKYRDKDGDWQTMDSDKYIVDTAFRKGRISLAEDEAWPGDDLYPGLPIKIEFVCGYGAQSRTALTSATNASPIVITSVGHGLSTGDRVRIESVIGNTAANGYWTVTKLTADTFSLNTSTGNAAYTSGGTFIKLDVPEAIRAAILILASNAYAHRESITIGQPWQDLPSVVNNLLADYRLGWFA